MTVSSNDRHSDSPGAKRIRRIFISIGSNMENGRKKVLDAIENLENMFDGFRCSGVYRTPCCRGKGPDYHNAVATFLSDRQSQDLENIFKEMENQAGRLRKGDGEVALDIDLVMADTAIVRPVDYERDYFQIGYRKLTDPRNLRIDEYIYELPEDRIALHPLPQRDRCKLLVCNDNAVKDETVFCRIGSYLPKNSLLIYNNTRVINARLRFAKETGATIEIFCLEPVSPTDYQLNFASCRPVRWKCMVGNSKRWKGGKLHLPLAIGSKTVMLSAERVSRDDNESVVEFSWDDSTVSFSEIISAAGVIPIPPYLNRETEDTDSQDYQTVYSRIEGSVAAPTAGLHFTEELLEELRKEGMETRSVTLHVGAGTFRPVKSDDIGGHEMHAELIDVTRELIAMLATNTRPVTAVGTTTVRTLESLYHIGCQIWAGQWQGALDQWYPYSTEHPHLTVKQAMEAILLYLDSRNLDRLVTSTQIIIAPPYRFRIVSNLVTNFHQPGSTLLLLVAAIVGESWKEIYRYALEHEFRFLSYGDACLFAMDLATGK